MLVINVFYLHTDYKNRKIPRLPVKSRRVVGLELQAVLTLQN